MADESGSVELGKLRIPISVDLDSLRAALGMAQTEAGKGAEGVGTKVAAETEKVKGKVKETGSFVSGIFQKSAEDSTRYLAGIGTAIAGAFSLATVGYAVKQIMSIGIAFDDALTHSMSVTQAMSADIREKLTAAALDMSKQSIFSAEQITSSFQPLRQAGLDTEQTIAALPVVVRYAEASLQDLGVATKELVQVQTVFNMRGKDTVETIENLGKVSDIIVRGSQLGRQSVAEFGQALTVFGPTAEEFKISIQDASAALAVLGGKGKDSVAAGSGLSMAIQGLTRAYEMNGKAFEIAFGKNALFDSEGQFKGIANAVDVFSRAVDNATPAQEAYIFQQVGLQKRVLLTMESLKDQGDAIRQNEQDLLHAGGTAKAVAEKNIDTLTGAFIELKNAVVGLGYEAFSPFIGSLVQIANAIKAFPEWLTNMWGGKAIPVIPKELQSMIRLTPGESVESQVDKFYASRPKIQFGESSPFGSLASHFGDTVGFNVMGATLPPHMNAATTTAGAKTPAEVAAAEAALRALKDKGGGAGKAAKDFSNFPDELGKLQDEWMTKLLAYMNATAEEKFRNELMKMDTARNMNLRLNQQDLSPEDQFSNIQDFFKKSGISGEKDPDKQAQQLKSAVDVAKQLSAEYGVMAQKAADVITADRKALSDEKEREATTKSMREESEKMTRVLKEQRDLRRQQNDELAKTLIDTGRLLSQQHAGSGVGALSSGMGGVIQGYQKFTDANEKLKTMDAENGTHNAASGIAETFGQIGSAASAAGSQVESLGGKFAKVGEAMKAAGDVSSTVMSAMSGNVIGVIQGVVSLIGDIGQLFSGAPKPPTQFELMMKDMNKALDDFGKKFSDTLWQLVKTGKADWSDFTDYVLQELFQIATNYAIVQPLEKGIRGMFAKGAAFDGGEPITYMARGSVVSSPVMFPMARGMGVMGEAGPEAVMPLTRTSTGELGVKAKGGGSVVNVHNYAGADIQTNVTHGDDGVANIEVMVHNIVNKGFRQGQYERTLRGMYPTLSRSGAY